jgi:signal transduction histidine kinase
LRLGEGDYGQDLSCAGPPEVRTCGEAANNLASKLGKLQSENRSLLQQLVEIQEEERRELSRELHDELGPMLFAIRANVTALAEQTTSDERDRREARERVMQAADELQQSTRRILNQLHPLYMDDIGFYGCVERIVRDARRERPQIEVLTNIDPTVEQLSQLLRRTLYRTIQESMTNAVKHSDATKVEIETIVRNDAVDLEVRDNGSSWRETPMYGRGLTGLRERVRALGGSFNFGQRGGWTRVACGIHVPRSEGRSHAGIGLTITEQSCSIEPHMARYHR